MPTLNLVMQAEINKNKQRLHAAMRRRILNARREEGGAGGGGSAVNQFEILNLNFGFEIVEKAGRGVLRLHVLECFELLFGYHVQPAMLHSFVNIFFSLLQRGRWD